MAKKKEKKVKKVKVPVYRTKEERQEESKIIIRKLTQLQLSIDFPAIRTLLKN